MIKNSINKLIKNVTFVVFDLETTGLSYKHHKIVEVAAIKMKNGKVLKEYETLIWVNYIPYEATCIHGITADMVKNAPDLETVSRHFRRFTKGCILVGHNVRRFDMQFANKHFKIKLDHPHIDTIDLSKLHSPFARWHSLDDVIKRLFGRIVKKGRHTAMTDAKLTLKIFKVFLKKGGFKTLQDLEDY